MNGPCTEVQEIRGGQPPDGRSILGWPHQRGVGVRPAKTSLLELCPSDLVWKQLANKPLLNVSALLPRYQAERHRLEYRRWEVEGFRTKRGHA